MDPNHVRCLNLISNMVWIQFVICRELRTSCKIRYICMLIFYDMGHIYCYRKKHLLIPNNKILMLPARCIYCYLFCCSPATKINEAPPPKKNKRLIVKAVHDRSTWWWFMTWHITTKALSVAINVTHVIEDQHAYISNFS